MTHTPSPLPTDPAAVPQRILNTGAAMPAVGLGTFGSDTVTAAQIADAVVGAARLGYRHFDCAPVYGNEAEVGGALQTVQADGVPREQLWITSKVWNDAHRRVRASCEQSLRDLKLDVLDLFLVHWPFPNSHGKGVDVSSRDPHAVPYRHEQFMETWAQMEKLVDAGLVRHIGTSNMTVPKLELLLRDCRIRPAASEMELHPHFQQPELFEFTTRNGMAAIGYSPVGSPARPKRDRTPEDTADVDDPVMQTIAAAHAIHPATLCVKWAAQRGQIPIPFSTTPRNQAANLQSVTTTPLSDSEMQAIAGIDKHCRLIKGQVFLWEGASDWRALWDENGRIIP